MPLTRNWTASAWTVTDELCTTVAAPFGPEIAQLTTLTCSPPGKVSCRLTSPVSSAPGTPLDEP
jgi:hypothetical protein